MLLAKFLGSSCPSCPRKESGSMFACHLRCPATAVLSGPMSTFGHTDLRHWSRRTCRLGRVFPLGTSLSPLIFFECAEALWKCCRWVSSTWRSGPPQITTKNTSSLNHDVLGQGPRQLTQAWMSPEDFHYGERIVAWTNRARYKWLAKWNRALLFLPSFLLNGTMLPDPQSCLLLPIPPLPIAYFSQRSSSEMKSLRAVILTTKLKRCGCFFKSVQ